MAHQRYCYLLPSQLHRLREAASPIDEAFDAVSVVLVGSCLLKPDYHDVDVRAILSDKRFKELFGEQLDQCYGQATALWTSLSTMYSEYLCARTGLKVDFQFQAISHANACFSGRRDALFVVPSIAANR